MSAIKKLGAQLSIAIDKKSDFMVGWEAANTESVQKQIEAYNSKAVEDYAKELVKELKF